VLVAILQSVRDSSLPKNTAVICKKLGNNVLLAGF